MPVNPNRPHDYEIEDIKTWEENKLFEEHPEWKSLKDVQAWIRKDRKEHPKHYRVNFDPGGEERKRSQSSYTKIPSFEHRLFIIFNRLIKNKPVTKNVKSKSVSA